MTLRYTNAILIGSAIGLFALASVSITPVMNHPWNSHGIVLTRTQSIPLWDFHQFSPTGEFSLDRRRRNYAQGPAHELHYKAIFLRFCMLFLQDGFYFLAIPIFLACLMTKLQELEDPYSSLVCFRRSIKLTGVMLLGIYVVFSTCLIFGFHSFEEGVIELIRLFWEGLVIAFFYGTVEILFLCSFLGHLYNMACEKDVNQKINASQ